MCEIECKLLPLLAISVRDVPWGKGERGAVINKAMAIERRHSPGDLFLTINPDDKHNPTCIRLGIAVSSNGSFPAVVGDLLDALQGGADIYEGQQLSEAALHRQAAGNAVASAMLFDRMLGAVDLHMSASSDDNSGMCSLPPSDGPSDGDVECFLGFS